MFGLVDGEIFLLIYEDPQISDATPTLQIGWLGVKMIVRFYNQFRLADTDSKTIKV